MRRLLTLYSKVAKASKEQNTFPTIHPRSLPQWSFGQPPGPEPTSSSRAWWGLIGHLLELGLLGQLHSTSLPSCCLGSSPHRLSIRLALFWVPNPGHQPGTSRRTGTISAAPNICLTFIPGRYLVTLPSTEIGTPTHSWSRCQVVLKWFWAKI